MRWVWVCAFVACVFAMATAPLAVSANTAAASTSRTIQLAAHIDHASLSPNIEDIHALPNSQWEPLIDGVHSLTVLEDNYLAGPSGHTLWLRLVIPAGLPKDLYLVQLVPNVGLYGELATRINGQWRWQKPIGNHAREGQFEVPANFLTFELDTQLAEQVAYIKLDSTQIFHFSVNIYDRESFVWQTFTSNLFSGIVFGFLILALLYNIAIGATAKESIYLYYAFYVFCSLVFLVVSTGYLRLLFPELEGQGRVNNFSATLIVFGATVFMRRFLQTKQHIPKFDRAIYTQQVVLFLALVLSSIVPATWAYLLAEFTGLFCPFLIFLTGVVSHRHGHPMAKYFLLAWSLLVVCATTWIFMWMGLVEPQLWTLEFVKLGILVEMACLSLVLGQRYDGLKKQAKTLSEARSKLQELSETDELTGLLNRRGFIKQVKRVFSSDPTNQYWLAIDIDHFKEFNDLHGHIAGDELLAKFGKLVESKTDQREDFGETNNSSDVPNRFEQIASRIGGEEFVIVLVNYTLYEAQAYADQLMTDFKKTSVLSDSGQPLATTVSIGATEIRAKDKLRSVWSRADSLLYRAKQNGRDRVEWSEPVDRVMLKSI